MRPPSSKDVELDFSKNYDDHLAKYLGIGMKSPCGGEKGGHTIMANFDKELRIPAQYPRKNQQHCRSIGY